jgi:hypothetical protein
MFWEITQAAKQGKRIVGVYAQGGTDAEKPAALELYGSAIVAWNTDNIVDAIEGRSNQFQNSDGTARDAVHPSMTKVCRFVGKIYMYVVDRDFGFAPNPFHGCCTLATCMPRIRAKAQVNDWVVGIGGLRLKATGRCVYAMRVTETLSFDEYWVSETYFDKRPVRNGSSVAYLRSAVHYILSPRRRKWLCFRCVAVESWELR